MAKEMALKRPKLTQRLTAAQRVLLGIMRRGHELLLDNNRTRGCVGITSAATIADREVTYPTVRRMIDSSLVEKTGQDGFTTTYKISPAGIQFVDSLAEVRR